MASGDQLAAIGCFISGRVDRAPRDIGGRIQPQCHARRDVQLPLRRAIRHAGVDEPEQQDRRNECSGLILKERGESEAAVCRQLEARRRAGVAPRHPGGGADDQQRHRQQQWKRCRRREVPPQRAQGPIGEEEDDPIPAARNRDPRNETRDRREDRQIGYLHENIRGMVGSEQVDEHRLQEIDPPVPLRMAQHLPPQPVFRAQRRRKVDLILACHPDAEKILQPPADDGDQQRGDQQRVRSCLHSGTAGPFVGGHQSGMAIVTTSTRSGATDSISIRQAAGVPAAQSRHAYTALTASRASGDTDWPLMLTRTAGAGIHSA